jgi:hypothetical protein
MLQMGNTNSAEQSQLKETIRAMALMEKLSSLKADVTHIKADVTLLKADVAALKVAAKDLQTDMETVKAECCSRCNVCMHAVVKVKCVPGGVAGRAGQARAYTQELATLVLGWPSLPWAQELLW